MSASMEALIAEHAAAPTPPLPVVYSPLPLPSPLTTSPTDTGAPLGYRAAGIRMRAAVASPPSLLPPTFPRTDVPEAHTALAMDREALYARIAWTSSEERSAAIEAHVRTPEAIEN
ncbi:hypothetical protein Tco_0224350 [Tanacetum coccineum]